MRHVTLPAALLTAIAGPACAETLTFLCTRDGLPRPDSKLVLDLSARRSAHTDTNVDFEFAAEPFESTGSSYIFQGQQDGLGGKIMHYGTLNKQTGLLTEYNVMASGRRYADSTSKCRLALAQRARRYDGSQLRPTVDLLRQRQIAARSGPVQVAPPRKAAVLDC